MKIYQSVFVFILSFFTLLVATPSASLVHAQQKSSLVQGIVVDESGEPLVGAGLLISGTTTGTITDLDGKFSFNVSADVPSLTVSCVGYVEQVLKPEFGKPMKIVLVLDNKVLDEVVVIAYGTSTKETYTGALSTVSNKDLVKAPVPSISNVLAGALPGVSTIQHSGQPGADGASVFIRGAGSLSDAKSAPLILVDGVERPFSEIDPEEIESISVLKDAASTAVFGVRGANGVMLVTTRRGSEGKPTISFKSTLGLQQPISLYRQTGSYEYATFYNQMLEYDKAPENAYFKPYQIEAFRTGSDPLMYPNVDWVDYMFRKLFMQSQNNINLSGGSKYVKYFVSMSYMYQNGILKQIPGQEYDNNYKYNRYNLRANLDINLTKTTKMKLNIGGRVGSQHSPIATSGIDHRIWTYAQVWTLPFAGAGFQPNPDGKLTRTIVPKEIYPITGVLRDGIHAFHGHGYNINNRTNLNMDLEIQQNLDMLTKGLSLSVKGAYDTQFGFSKHYKGNMAESQMVKYQSMLTDPSKPETDPDYDKTIVYIPQGRNSSLSYENGGKSRARNWYLEGKINYNRKFGKHRVGAMLLYNQSRNYYPSSYTYIPHSYVGYVGRMTYNYDNRYLFDMNAGYNGSENFAPGKTRYGFFPSASFGWVVSNENFMKKQDVIDYLKIRLSAGLVGSDGTGRFMYMPGSWTDGGSYSFGVNNPAGFGTSSFGVPGNEKVSWEEAMKYNFGVEMEFFNHRLTFGGDVFYEHRTGILIPRKNTPGIIATPLPALNLGKVDNKGFELQLGWHDSTQNSFNYSINGNVSYVRNKVLFMDEVRNDFEYMNLTGKSTGVKANLYEFERMYQYSDFTEQEDGSWVLNPDLPQPSFHVQPGDCKYADLNGDQVVDDFDRLATGFSARPELTFGLNTDFSWKGFSLSMQWAGATNVNKFLEAQYRTPFGSSGKFGLLDFFYNGCWTPENQENAIYPRSALSSKAWNSFDSTLWLKDSSYLRLKTLSLGYTLRNKAFMKKIGLSSLGVYISGFNLLTFSSLDIIDPEGSSENNGGYPLVKVYNFGLNLKF